MKALGGRDKDFMFPLRVVIFAIASWLLSVSPRVNYKNYWRLFPFPFQIELKFVNPNSPLAISAQTLEL